MIDVAAIGGDGVFGQMAFVAQMLDEGVAPTAAARPTRNGYRFQGSARRHMVLPQRKCDHATVRKTGIGALPARVGSALF